MKNYPDELKSLQDELIVAVYELQQFLVLYEPNKPQRDLMMHYAGAFFSILYNFFWDRFAIYISRLADPASDRRYENISIRSAQKYYSEFDGIDKKTIDEKIDEIISLSEPFKTKRNKLLAHSDRDAIINKTLAKITLNLQHVKRIYILVGEILNEFRSICSMPHMDWNVLCAEPGARGVLTMMMYGDALEQQMNVDPALRSQEYEILEKGQYGRIDINCVTRPLG